MDRRQYLRHFAMLFSGTVAGQALNLASYPLLARIYSPAAFGAFATFIAATAVPGAIACLRFDLAVPTAPKWGRFAILWLCVFISAAAGLISILGSAVYWLAVERTFNPMLPVLFGLTIFITGFCLAATLYLMRHDQYRSTSVSAVARTGATALTQLGLGLFSPSSFSLIVGSVVGLIVQGFMLAWAMRVHARPRPPRRSQMLALFRRYRRQVAVDIPGTILAIGSMNMPTFVIAALFGQRIVGYYGFAQRIAILPLQLFNDSLSQVFFQKAARAHEESGHFWPELRFNLIATTLVSLGTVAGIWLFAKPVVALYLGSQWSPVATMLIVLAPMLGIRSVAYSITPSIFVLRRVHWRFIHFVIEAVLHAICYAVAIAEGLSSIQYLMLLSALFGLEWLRFLVQMIIGAWKIRGSNTRV
jgi:O-antigen/teichoic acid export membrane protein